MLPALLLIPLVALFRIVMAWQTTAHPAQAWGWPPGFCPLSAVAFCAGAYLPRRLALALPLGILLVSDVVIDALCGVSFWTGAMAAHYLTLGLIVLLGAALRERAGERGVSALAALTGTAGGSAAFYLLTNTLCWAGSPDYAPTFAGWTQALTTGQPGYLPSIYFFRNALVSDMLYSILFVFCLGLAASRSARFRLPPAADASRPAAAPGAIR